MRPRDIHATIRTARTAGALYLLMSLTGFFSIIVVGARRLEVPDADLVGAKRRRLEARLTKLPKLYSWGDLTDEDYRREMAETRTMLAELPDPNKLLAFDRNRRVMLVMAENVANATRPQLAELVQLLVERVQAKGRRVEPESIEWTPPARPFFEPTALLWRPRTGAGR
jgi:hypothetical protein